ncbi:MAG: TerC family protein, partial [Deltaproteobacteria bacterium]|nr:TerC family protein [Deltaproteobacteria bacterium]
LRGIFIAAGVGLLTYFHWTIYLFGAFLVYTGVKLLRAGEVQVEPQKNPVLRFFTRLMPIETTYDQQKFFVRRNGKLVGTALVPVLIVIETTDVMFAVSLGIVGGILVASIVASLVFPPAANPGEEQLTDGSAAPKGGPAGPDANGKGIKNRAA